MRSTLTRRPPGVSRSGCGGSVGGIPRATGHEEATRDRVRRGDDHEAPQPAPGLCRTLPAAGRACRRLPDQADPLHRPGRSRRRQRHDRARRHRALGARDRPALRGREPGRRRRRDREPEHRARGARRLHADAGLCRDARHDSGDTPRVVRRDQGFHADRHDRRDAERPRRQRQPAAEDARRVHRLRAPETPGR